MTLQVGDQVLVRNKYKRERRAYPFMPDLAGKKGTIKSLVTETPIAKMALDQPIYWVEFEPFKVGIVPHGESSFAYEPTEFVVETKFSFLEEMLMRVR